MATRKKIRVWKEYRDEIVNSCEIEFNANISAKELLDGMNSVMNVFDEEDVDWVFDNIDSGYYETKTFTVNDDETVGIDTL